jgi:hypothetical protein
MRRSLLSVVLAAAAVCIFEPVVTAQFEQAPNQAYPPVQNPRQNYPQMQQPQASQDEQDIAADEQHGVARLSIVQGDVNVKRGDNGQLEAAAINTPLMANDHVQTSAGSRAEVELDYGNLVRLGPNTDLGVADLEYHRYRLQFGAGTIIYRVLRDAGSQAEIDTPSIAVRPLTEGEYRISVLDDGTTQITVRSGQAEIDGPRGSQRLDPGRTTLVRGDPSDPEYQTTYEIARDQLDDWSANRDSELLGSQSYQHVSPDIPGADDLDRYGTWVPSQYGQVWAPQPPSPDWSPYSDGQWTWEDYYGWTWVDAAPWGWAPYHYGRWFWNAGYGWCWWPGAFRARYAWSPALVGFFGWGGGFGFGFGGIGWVALAPYEVCHPWWGRHGFYGGRYGFRPYNYNLRNVDIARMYRNANFRGGAMSAAYGNFGGPGQHFRAATRAQLTNATFFRGQMPVSPSANAFRFSSRPAIPNTRLASVSSGRFFQAPQTRFGAQRGAFGSRFGSPHIGQPQTAHGIAPNMQGRFAGQGTPRVQTQTRPSTGGWQRFGDPRNPGTYRQGFAPGSGDGGWHRFGEPQMFGPGNYGGRFNSPATPRHSTPSAPRYNPPSPRYSAPAPQRYSPPSYRAPEMPRYSQPRYSEPRFNAPRYSAPRYSAPSGGEQRGGGSPRGGGGPSHGGGGGGSHGGGGGGHHR